MSLYIGLGKTGLVKTENIAPPRVHPTVPYEQGYCRVPLVRVPDMDPPPSSALSLFILVYLKTTSVRLHYSTVRYS